MPPFWAESNGFVVSKKRCTYPTRHPVDLEIVEKVEGYNHLRDVYRDVDSIQIYEREIPSIRQRNPK